MQQHDKSDASMFIIKSGRALVFTAGGAVSKTGIANKQHTRKHISPNISIRTCTRAQACASLSQYSLSRPHSHMRTEEHVLSFPSLLLAFFQIQFLTSLSVMMNSGFYSQNGSAVFGFSSVRSILLYNFTSLAGSRSGSRDTNSPSKLSQSGRKWCVRVSLCLAA